MLRRAFCHAGGVKTVDDQFRGRGFSYGRAARHAPVSVTPTRSEWERMQRRLERRAPMPTPSDAMHAFSDDGTLGLAVLPPDFTFPTV